MLKKTFAPIIPLVIGIGMIGCSDDTPTISVNPTLKFTEGDEFTYDYYDRDETNVRLDAPKQIVVWTALRTDLDTLNRRGVTEFEEVRYEADGTTEISRSKFYMIADEQGKLLFHNLPQVMMSLFQTDALNLSSLIDEVPDTWTQISDTKSPSPLTWSRTQSKGVVENAAIAFKGIPITADIDMEIGVNSEHAGRVSTAVTAGTYEASFSTTTYVLVNLTAASDIIIPIPISPITIPKGQVIVDDSLSIEYHVDLEAGILQQIIDSKTVKASNVLDVPVNGSEMELTSFTRAATEEG